MYSSLPGTSFFAYPTDSDNGQPGPSTYRTFSPAAPLSGANTPSNGAAFNPYMSSNYHHSSLDGNVQGDFASSSGWRQAERDTDPSSSRGGDDQMMSWSSQPITRNDGYQGGQWDEPISPALSIGYGFGRHDATRSNGNGGEWRTGNSAIGRRSDQVDNAERRETGVQELGENDGGKRDILLLNQALAELISLLVPFRPTSSGHSPPDPPTYILPRLAHLANTVHTILHRLSPRFRLHMAPPPPAVPPPRHAKSRTGGRSHPKKASGRTDPRDLTSPEREMQAIRKRRDALIMRAKEGQKGGQDGNSKGVKETKGEERVDGEEADGEPRGRRLDGYADTETNGENSSQTAQAEQYQTQLQHDYMNPHQQQLHQLGSNIGVGNYDNRSSFIPAPYHNSTSRTFTDSLIFGPPPDTIENGANSQFHSAAGSTLTFGLETLPLSSQLDSGQMQQMPFDMPPPSTTPFDYSTYPSPRLENEGYAADGGFVRQRCHGCGVLVEGRWMQGPDGPSSLCVSCGLHYAKLNKRRVGEGGDTNVDIEPWSAVPVVAGLT